MTATHAGSTNTLTKRGKASASRQPFSVFLLVKRRNSNGIQHINTIYAAFTQNHLSYPPLIPNARCKATYANIANQYTAQAISSASKTAFK